MQLVRVLKTPNGFNLSLGPSKAVYCSDEREVRKKLGYSPRLEKKFLATEAVIKKVSENRFSIEFRDLRSQFSVTKTFKALETAIGKLGDIEFVSA